MAAGPKQHLVVILAKVEPIANTKAMMPPMIDGLNCMILPETNVPSPYSIIKKGKTVYPHPNSCKDHSQYKDRQIAIPIHRCFILSPNIGFDLPGFFFFLPWYQIEKIIPTNDEQPNQIMFFIVENMLQDKLAGAGNKSDPAPNKKVNAVVGHILLCFGDHGLDKLRLSCGENFSSVMMALLNGGKLKPVFKPLNSLISYVC